MLKKYLCRGAVLGTMLVLGACAVPLAPVSTPTPIPLTPVRLCYSSGSGTQLPLMYAKEKGLFTKHGLEADLSLIDGGSNAAAALVSGAVDVCILGASNVINVAAAGEDLVIIGGLVNTMPFVLMVRPEIKAVEDLRGRALAISSPGGSSDLATRAMLKKMGLEPDKEVALVSIGNQTENLAAMETGAVVGTLVSVPQTVKAEEQGFHGLVDAADLGITYPHTSLATTRTFIAGHRPEALAVMRAVVEGLVQMKQDETGVKEVLAKYLSLDPEKDAASLDEAYTAIVGRYLAQRPFPPLDGIQTVIGELSTDNPKVTTLTAQGVVDSSLLEELDKEGLLPPKSP